MNAATPPGIITVLNTPFTRTMRSMFMDLPEMSRTPSRRGGGFLAPAMASEVDKLTGTNAK